MMTSVEVMIRIYQQCSSLHDHCVDCYTGTSSGGILACMLALGWSPRQILEHMLANTGIMRIPLWYRIVSMGGMLSPVHPSTSLEKWLVDIFGDSTLNDLPRHVIVTSYNIRTQRSRLFHNLRPGAGHHRVVDVLMKSCSVPIMLPLSGMHMDGAIFAPNPAAHAVILCKQYVCDIDSIRLLTVGTTTYPCIIPSDSRVGMLWALMHPLALVQHMYRASLRGTDMILSGILRDSQWRRVEVQIPGERSRTSLRGWAHTNHLVQTLRTSGQKTHLPEAWIREVFCCGRTSPSPSAGNIF